MNEPMDILKSYPVRKSEKQKKAFRDSVVNYVKSLGYEANVEKGSLGARNVVIGNPEKAKYLVTAHYDTPVTLGFANVSTPCSRKRFIMTILISVLIGAGIGMGLRLLVPEEYLGPGSAMIFIVLYLMFYAAFRLQLFPANKNNANDNTSGVVTVLEILRTLPKNHRDKVCFVLFDQEERGLKGSAAYRKTHKAATETQLVLNLDCVGDGEHILLMPNKQARLDAELIGRLKYLGGWFGNKQILTIDKGYCSANSDHKNFPYAVGIGAYHKKKGKTYVLDKIHTKHDVNLDMTNVNLLRAALTSFICGDAAK